MSYNSCNSWQVSRAKVSRVKIANPLSPQDFLLVPVYTLNARSRSENSDCSCIQNICPTPRIERAIYFGVISSDARKQK